MAADVKSKLELMLWNAEADSLSSSDLYLWLRESGLSSEVAIRLKGLIDVTAELADQVINIGKIVLMKIIEFIKAHPNLAVGVALGAAVGLLVGAIPLLGPLLAPITMALGIAAGAIAGHKMDKLAKGQQLSIDSDPMAIAADVIEIAKAFFQLLIDTINAVVANQQLRVITK